MVVLLAVLVDRLFLEIRRLPHLLDIVEFPDLGTEDVDDDITDIDEHPVRSRQPFDPGRSVTGVAQGTQQVVGYRRYVPVRPTGCNDHIVGNCRFALDID